MRRVRGFTLLEMVIAVAILGVLVSMATPLLQLAAQRQQESELRAALREIRTALDAYKQATADARVRVSADASGYPERLENLVEGVVDVSDPRGRRIYFLRRLPRDPFARPDLSAAETWLTRSYASPPDAPAPGADVFDVKSRAPGVGLNGIAYQAW